MKLAEKKSADIGLKQIAFKSTQFKTKAHWPKYHNKWPEFYQFIDIMLKFGKVPAETLAQELCLTCGLSFVCLLGTVSPKTHHEF